MVGILPAEKSCRRLVPIIPALAATLFRAPGYGRAMFLDRGTTYDVTADGQQFVIRVEASASHAVLVQNWRAKLGAPR